MKSTLALSYVQTARLFFDRVLAVLSCFTIPVLIASSLVWSIDKAPQQSISIDNPVEATAGHAEPIVVGAPLELQLPVRRSYYWISIQDQSGSQVYQYPTKKIGDMTKFDFKNLKVEVPPSLPRGQYTVTFHLTYWFNPFKDGQANVKIATLDLN